jgi:hypothetical protein
MPNAITITPPPTGPRVRLQAKRNIAYTKNSQHTGKFGLGT